MPPVQTVRKYFPNVLILADGKILSATHAPGLHQTRFNKLIHRPQIMADKFIVLNEDDDIKALKVFGLHLHQNLFSDGDHRNHRSGHDLAFEKRLGQDLLF